MSTCPPSNLPTTLGENFYYIVINMQAILYGVFLTLYVQTMHIFFRRRRERHPLDIPYATFSTVMLLAVTISLATTAIQGERMWLLDRDYPGGPQAYVVVHFTDSYLLLGAVMATLLEQMTDALMIHRVRVLWDSLIAIIIPCILWLATLVLAILVCWVSSRPNETLFIGLELRLGLAYYTIAVFLNTTLTCMLCMRVLWHARTVKKSLGAEYASPYYTVAILIVESMLPFTLTGIVFLVTLGVKSPVEVIFSRLYVLMTCVSPQMLILRVAKGKAWNRESFRVPESGIVFTPGDAPGAGVSGESRSDESGDVEKAGVKMIRFASPPA